jgi:uncharacterized membrane protein YqhA
MDATPRRKAPSPEPPPRHSWIEDTFETILFQSRFLLLAAVLGSLFASLMMFVKGVLEIGSAATDLCRQLHLCQAAPDDRGVVFPVVTAIENFLFATALLIFATGIYEIFISEIDPQIRIDPATGKLKLRPSWLHFRSLDDLKTQIGKVVMIILVVTLFEWSLKVHYGEPADLLFLGGGLFLVAISLLAVHSLKHRVGAAPGGENSQHGEPGAGGHGSGAPVTGGHDSGGHGSGGHGAGGHGTGGHGAGGHGTGGHGTA